MPNISRPLPPALSNAQRDALSQFFAGRLSAGQLSERLALVAPPAAEPEPAARPAAPRVRLLPLRLIAARRAA